MAPARKFLIIALLYVFGEGLIQALFAFRIGGLLYLGLALLSMYMVASVVLLYFVGDKDETSPRTEKLQGDDLFFRWRHAAYAGLGAGGGNVAWLLVDKLIHEEKLDHAHEHSIWWLGLMLFAIVLLFGMFLVEPLFHKWMSGSWPAERMEHVRLGSRVIKSGMGIVLATAAVEFYKENALSSPERITEWGGMTLLYVLPTAGWYAGLLRNPRRSWYGGLKYGFVSSLLFVSLVSGLVYWHDYHNNSVMSPWIYVTSFLELLGGYSLTFTVGGWAIDRLSRSGVNLAFVLGCVSTQILIVLFTWFYSTSGFEVMPHVFTGIGLTLGVLLCPPSDLLKPVTEDPAHAAHGHA